MLTQVEPHYANVITYPSRRKSKHLDIPRVISTADEMLISCHKINFYHPHRSYYIRSWRTQPGDRQSCVFNDSTQSYIITVTKTILD